MSWQDAYQIRGIEPRDNPGVKALVVEVLKEFGCMGPGYACNDAELDDMHGAYQAQGGRYWVIEEKTTGRIVGGGGFARLKGTTPEEAVCELQKLYFFPELRGKGLGKAMMEIVMDEAIQAGYETMYLETIPPMSQAIGLYQRFGFTPLDHHMGDTGHHERCKVYMARTLNATPQSSLSASL